MIEHLLFGMRENSQLTIHKVTIILWSNFLIYEQLKRQWVVKIQMDIGP